MNSEVAYILGRMSCTRRQPKNIIEASEYYIPEEPNQWELLLDKHYAPDFARGLYEGTYNSRNPDVVNVECIENYAEILKTITRTNGIFTGEPNSIKDRGVLTFVKHNALDFLSFVYSKGKPDNFYSDFCYKKYVKLSNSSTNCIQEFQYKKLVPEAVAPFKDRASDSGYDLTLIKLIKRVGNTFWYSTGISVEPPNGFYFDLVPRSSLSKTGFMLANSVGIVDRSYTGDIIVVLNQIDHTMPDLELPFRGVQLIPRSIVHMKPLLVEELLASVRGSKGFGSSGY